MILEHAVPIPPGPGQGVKTYTLGECAQINKLSLILLSSAPPLIEHSQHPVPIMLSWPGQHLLPDPAAPLAETLFPLILGPTHHHGQEQRHGGGCRGARYPVGP